MITQEEWDHLDDEARMRRLASLARRLPEGFEPVGLRDFALGEAFHRVAELRRGDDRFVLIPGGERSVGFDVERGWEPDPGERQSWDDAAEEYGIADSLSTYLARVLRPRRRIMVPPLLVEVRAREVGFRRVDASDPSVADLITERAGRPGTVTIYRGDRHLRMTTASDGNLVVEIAEVETHASIVAGLSREGSRPPTSDEWEYLCGAGTQTLYRWGDHAPTDRYPTDSAARGDSVPSRDFDLHRRPNALGLEIASDPYHLELTTDARVRRGGDGGCAVCGGMGWFLGWLPLATAYFEPEYCGAEPGSPIDVGYTYVRRCFPLDAT